MRCKFVRERKSGQDTGLPRPPVQVRTGARVVCNVQYIGNQVTHSAHRSYRNDPRSAGKQLPKGRARSRFPPFPFLRDPGVEPSLDRAKRSPVADIVIRELRLPMGGNFLVRKFGLVCHFQYLSWLAVLELELRGLQRAGQLPPCGIEAA